MEYAAGEKYIVSLDRQSNVAEQQHTTNGNNCAVKQQHTIQESSYAVEENYLTKHPHFKGVAMRQSMALLVNSYMIPGSSSAVVVK